MKDCIFCQIVLGKVPAEIVYENEIATAFLDINPVNEGHLLLIPKDHFPSFIETPDTIISSLFLIAKKIIPRLKMVTGADFIALTIIGTDVPHFHIHLIPRFYNDGLAGFWPTKKYEDEKKIRDLGQKIKDSLLKLSSN